MTRSSRTPAFAPRREFDAMLRSLSHKHQLWRVFADFCELAALAYANAVVKSDAREQRYAQVVGGYDAEEVALFPKLLGCVVAGLEDLDRDFLGEAFMELELSSHWHGQFFTPIALCRTIAELTLDEGVTETIAERGFVTAHEPAAGAGALLIAFAAAMRARDLNPQRQLHVVAIDKDPTAAHMCFVQLAALGIPARVFIGDTLRMQMTSVFETPFHHLGFWDGKLRRGYALGSPADPERGGLVSPPAAPVVLQQLALFDEPKRGAA